MQKHFLCELFLETILMYYVRDSYRGRLDIQINNSYEYDNLLISYSENVGLLLQDTKSSG